jgi:O-antigen ligase
MEFASSIKFHPTYLSVYFITAIVFGVSLLGRSRLLNTLIITGILLLITEIFLLSSKMSAIILFVVLLLITVYAVFHSSKRIQQIALISFFTTVVIVLILFPASLYRIHTIVTDLNTSNSTAQQDLSTTNLHRITLWKNAIALFREKPVTGYGLLGTKKAMDSYNARYTTTHFNTHNQYLMFLLIGGCVGALLFLVSQLILLLRSVRAGDYIYAVFLLTILLSLLTENLISRHTGVVLYAFFNALFYLHLCNARDEKI